MKIFSLLAAACLLCSCATAQTPDLQPAPSSVTPLSQAIENSPFITTHKPNPHAQYYMYFFTASWCSPCRAIMPKIIAEYPNMMQGRRLEVIVVSFDDTAEQALAYLNKSKAPFAALMFTSLSQFPLPGCPADVNAIPHIVVVDALGNFIYRGHALRFAEWKSRTTPSEK